MAQASFLAYEEPSITTILIYASFLILLNILSHLLDKLLYCGLIGQVLLGIAWGAPGSHWLPDAAQETIVQLGYVGLILMVYEGGLSTSLLHLRANLTLSMFVAFTGVGFPIAFSFILIPLTNASRIQSLVSGIALCSTSLGTMFTVLNSSGLSKTRVGVVLASAAMIDDVIGLVMVQVAEELGSSGDAIAPSVILRPILVSLAFAVITPLLYRYVLLHCVSALCKMSWPLYGSLEQSMHRRRIAWIAHTTVLIAFVTGASYAGTSNLFAAYLAGLLIAWWDQRHINGDPETSPGADAHAAGGVQNVARETSCEQLAPRVESTKTSTTDEQERPRCTCHFPLSSPPTVSGLIVYEHYYKQIVERILKPMFFASIGFSIPISNMFAGSIVWKGVVYSVLMALGKLTCGIWLLRIPIPTIRIPSSRPKYLPRFSLTACFSSRSKNKSQSTRLRHVTSRRVGPEASENTQPQVRHDQSADNTSQHAQASQRNLTSAAPRKSISLYPATTLGCAMVARGEIGFLISSIAQSKGIFGSQSLGASTSAPPDIFLIVTWAIVLCTLFGPTAVGALVRRMKKLEARSKDNALGQEEGARDVLGAWGVT